MAAHAAGDAVEDLIEKFEESTGIEIPHELADKLEDAAEDAVEDAVERAEEDQEESKKSKKSKEPKEQSNKERANEKESSAGDPMKFNYQQPGKKATTILSPHLETISYGSMIIVLDNSQTSLPYNKPITGKIKVNLKSAFDAKALTLGIRGYQRSHFTSVVQGDQFGKAGTANSSSRLAKTIISESLVVQEFAPDVVQIGQSEYAFALYLPDSITETVMCQFNENNISTTYYLVAQMEPRHAIDFANLEDKTSLLRTDYAIYLWKPHNTVEENKLGNPSGGINPNLTKTLTMKVGGIGGLGASESSSVISLEKERFAPGEMIRVHFDVDNTKCKKAVKNFKIKLKRTIHCLSGRKGVAKPLLTEEEWICDLKYDGCAEKTKEIRTIEF